MRTVLLISNRVMHYRVSVYNYFADAFRDCGWELKVLSNELQRQNRTPMRFEFREVPFHFGAYRRILREMKPDAVVLFLHMKDAIIWPLIHWLKWNGIPVAFWTKGVNLDDPDNRVRYAFFNHLHTVSDALILYSRHESRYIRPKNRHKISAANNTVNFADFPDIAESKEALKAEFDIPFEKVVLFVGRMGIDGGRKRVDHLIRAFRDITIPGAGVVIVGSGLSDELRGLLRPETGRYLGEIHDPDQIQISKVFKLADICALPGHVGLGLNQAFYWGLPVITEEGRQPPEFHYLRHGQNGLVVPENDVNGLREALVHLLEDDATRERLAKQARIDILEHASIERMFAGFRDGVFYAARNRTASGSTP